MAPGLSERLLKLECRIIGRSLSSLLPKCQKRSYKTCPHTNISVLRKRFSLFLENPMFTMMCEESGIMAYLVLGKVEKLMTKIPELSEKLNQSGLTVTKVNKSLYSTI